MRDPRYREPHPIEWALLILFAAAIVGFSWYWADGWQHYGASRRSAIIAELCRLSRDGWAYARYADYAPLEAELRQLEEPAHEH